MSNFLLVIAVICSSPNRHLIFLAAININILPAHKHRQPNVTLANNRHRTCNRSVDLIAKGVIKPTNALVIRALPPPAPPADSPDTDTDPFPPSPPSPKPPIDIVAPKELYALSGLEWSIDRDVVQYGKRKWLFGPLRMHVQYLWSGALGRHCSATKSATLSFVGACQGCSTCATVTAVALCVDVTPPVSIRTAMRASSDAATPAGSVPSLASCCRCSTRTRSPGRSSSATSSSGSAAM